MSKAWISVSEQLPEDDQRVLGFIPSNKVFLPGKNLEFELREVVVLRFCKDFYAKNEEKRAKYGLHFGLAKETATTSLQTLRIGVPFPKGHKNKKGALSCTRSLAWRACSSNRPR